MVVPTIMKANAIPVNKPKNQPGTMQKPRAIAVSLAIAWIAFCAGCGQGRPTCVPVAGKVVIDGQPLPDAVVAFYPPTGRPSMARTDASGTFRLKCFDKNDGAQLGTHKVTVTAVERLNAAELKWLAPKKYADHTQSGVEVVVDKPIDDMELHLTWNGAKPFIEKNGDGSGD